MSDARDDRVDARLTGIESTVEQMDKRLGRIEEQLDTVDGRVDSVNQRLDDRFTALRHDMRRWLYLLLFTVGLVVTAVTAVIQVVLA